MRQDLYMETGKNGLENCLEFVKAFAMTAIKLITEPEHLEKIKAEYDKSVNGQGGIYND